MFSGSSLGWWESPGWLPRGQNPSFPWQLHLGWLLQMPSRSGAAQAPACSCATDRRTQAQRRQQPKQLLPRRYPRPHSREQVRPGTEPPPSLTRFAGSLCSAEGSSLAYPEAREPRDDVQSSGALGQRLTCPGPGCSASLPREAQPAAAADTAFHCKHRRAQHLLSDHHLVSHAQRHLSVAIQREPLFAGAHTPSSHVPEGPGQHQPMGTSNAAPPGRPERPAGRLRPTARLTSHISRLASHRGGLAGAPFPADCGKVRACLRREERKEEVQSKDFGLFTTGFALFPVS